MKRALFILLAFATAGISQTATADAVTFTPPAVTPGNLVATAGAGTAMPLNCTATGDNQVPASQIVINCTYGKNSLTSKNAVSPGTNFTLKIGPINGAEIDFTIVQATAPPTSVTATSLVNGTVTAKQPQPASF